MSDKILMVDDDANLLASAERNLRRQFQVETALGGEAALAKIAERGPYAVVVSDRQMPGMDGIQFLTLVKQRAPDTVRMMLTGNADLEGTIRVVNEGGVFSFLTKPCPVDVLARALENGLTQYRLIMAEKELLNKTLSGSIKLLTDILSLMEPQSFGRAQTMRDVIASIAGKFSLENAWEIHLAVMLAPIGYVTIPPETLLKARKGEMLSKVEEQMLTQIPETAARLLANIPRLEGVSRIVRYQHKQFNGAGFPPDSVTGDKIPAGARLIRILTDLAELQTNQLTRVQALDQMQERTGWYDPAFLAAVRVHYCGTAAVADTVRASLSVTIRDLKPGMILRSDIQTKEGTLILTTGHQISEMTLEKIQNFDRISGLKEPIFVELPKTANPGETTTFRK
ncbi:MAG TPA: HD domain-containing phosphohydrolase [Verrucomicrobiae bacterium]|nr:HD domain-containing phosphohydrolase [Verrucomicrobiae bacterium]